MHNLRMELNRIEAALLAFHACHRADRCVSSYPEAFRSFFYIIGMAHPADRFWAHGIENPAVRLCIHFRLSILADRSRRNASPQHISHQLRTIADSKDRNSHLKDFFFTMRGILLIYTVGTSGKNDSLRIHFPDLIQSQCVWMNLTVNIAFSDSSGNQLVILTTEIQNNNHFSFHGYSSYYNHVQYHECRK